MGYFRELYLGFGRPEELKLQCVRRAYRDFNRTWHIAGDENDRNCKRKSAESAIVAALTALQRGRLGQPEFDKWQSDVMGEIMRATDPAGQGTGMTLGQAQKWTNMSVKYAVCAQVPDFDWLDERAHVPIDKMLISELKKDPK